ncbi:MAG: MFS transporter [Planctomycetia bacterium]|nr:MAG: MFS transporter [Planctomycetia bacterium]
MTAPPVADAALRRDLRFVMVDGVMWSLMVGVGEFCFALFVLAVTGSEVASGLAVTVPVLAGAVLQLASPFGVRALGSQKRWVVLCVALQTLAFVPLAAVALAWPARPAAGEVRTALVPVLFGIAALYWAGGMAAGGAWFTWMSSTVPAAMRTRYFSTRTRWAQLGALTSFVAAGVYLQAYSAGGANVAAFAVLFAAAFLFRAVSTGLLIGTRESTPLPADVRVVPIGEWLRRLVRRSGGLQLVQCVLAMQFTSMIAGPFFTAFIKRELHGSDAEWMMLNGTTILFKILSTPLWGWVATRYGARLVFLCAGIGIAPLAALWVVHQNYVYLLAVQMASGLAWGAWELAVVLLTFETLREHERTSILTTQNLFNAVAMVAGSSLGGLLLYAAGNSYHAYLVIFTVSSIARLAVIPLMWQLYRRRPPPDGTPAAAA